MLEEIGVAMVSGLIIGVIMTVMLYITAPKMTPRFMKGADIEGKVKRMEDTIDKKVHEVETRISEVANGLMTYGDNKIFSITSSLDAKADGLYNAVDDRLRTVVETVNARVEKIFSNDIPHLLQEELPKVVDGMISDIMSEENIGNIKTIISSGVAEGLTPIGTAIKMALVGQKGNEAKVTNKSNLEAQKALAETAIRSHPQGEKILALAKQFDFDVPQMAAENPELAQMAIQAVSGFMNKQNGGGGTGAGPTEFKGWC